MKKYLYTVAGAFGLSIISSSAVSAAAEGSETGIFHFGSLFAAFALLLIAGKIGNIIERYGQPAVIGELLAGVALAVAGYLGWDYITTIPGNEVMAFIASFGALLLLFGIGLESNIKEMRKVGPIALMVALIGVVLPFTIGVFALGPWLFAEESSNSHLFLGAAMVATSVGITASILRGLGKLKTDVGQTILGAAVIDDVLGLIILAVVTSLASGGELTTGLVSGLVIKSFGFLIGSIVLGVLFARPISALFARIHTGVGMKVALAMAFALTFGWLAEVFGLEPIIGAFAAGLMLDPVHFSTFSDPHFVHDLKEVNLKSASEKKALNSVIQKHSNLHIEDLIGSIGHLFIPIFFVFTGLQIDIESLLKPDLYLIAFVISIVAIITKMAAGLAMKGARSEKLLVGTAMVPRGEVGLVFAATGKAVGVLSADMFSVIILVVIFTTLVAPFMIKRAAQSI